MSRRNNMHYILSLKKYKFLIEQLVSRDFKVKYKRSFLGVAWSLLNPVLTMAVMYIVFSNFFRFSVPGISYAAYLFTGQIMFNYFSEASNLSMSTIIANASLINKVYVPKYIFPLTKCLFVGINFLMTLVPLYAVLLITGTGLCWQHLLLPYVFICLFMFTFGAGMILATITVFMRDMLYIYTVFLTLLTYATPLFWTMDIVTDPVFIGLLKCNPLYHFIDFARTIMLYHQTPTVEQFVICGILAVVFLFVGAFVFKKHQNEFVYYI